MSANGRRVGWRSVRLGAVVQPKRDRAVPRDYPDAPFIGMDAVEAHTMRLLGTVLAGTMRSSAVRFSYSDVLYGRLRPYLNKVVKPGFDGLASAEFIVFPDTPEMRSSFLQYRMNATDFVQFASEQHTGDRPRVGFEELADFEIALPPVQEQDRLVAKLDELFSDLDAGVAALERVEANLARYRAAVLKAAVEGKLVPTEAALAKAGVRDYETARVALETLEPPPKPPGYKSRSKDVIRGHAALAVGNPGDPLPEGWTWVALTDVARLETGHTPSRRHPEWWDGDIPWIGIKDARIHDGRIIHSTLQHTNADGLANSAARLLPVGTVCLSRTASVGYVVVMGVAMATSQDFVNWVCTPALDPDWLRIVLLADRQALFRFGKGTTHTTIYFPEVMSLHVALPPLLEQRRIVAEVDRLLSVADHGSAAVDRAEVQVAALRSGVLRSAFRGDLTTEAALAGAEAK